MRNSVLTTDKWTDGWTDTDASQVKFPTNPAREIFSFNRNIVKYLRGEFSDIPTVKLAFILGGILIIFPQLNWHSYKEGF